MKSLPSSDRREKTRHAILEALTAVFAETGGAEFSIQQVADRAGVTHRTVYNHFPTREALRDAVAEHIEARLAQIASPPDAGEVSVATMPSMAKAAYAAFEKDPAALRTCVLFMLTSRGPARVTSRRTTAFHRAIESEMPADAPVTSRAATAAVRMFLSSTGWHLLTEHYGLSPREAAATAAWASQVLLEAATRK